MDAMRKFVDDRLVEIGSALLVELAKVWRNPGVSRLQILVNPNFKSTIARWLSPSGVLEISPSAESRGATEFCEIISHEAAHFVVWYQSGSAARPHGPEWAALMRAAGFEPRATLVRCGHRRGGDDRIRIRHFCTVCHFSKFAKRRMPHWRCPECRAIGLEGKLKMER